MPGRARTALNSRGTIPKWPRTQGHNPRARDYVIAMTESVQPFEADVSRVLDLVINSLYKEREIFLRELISNASDACDKLRYQSLSQPELLGDDPELKIRILSDEAECLLTVSDNGIGMSREDLVENLGTIARSGTGRFLEQLSGEKEHDLRLIGQFGVGFYSVFMVADKVVVQSRRAGEEQGWLWASDGRSGYSTPVPRSRTTRGPAWYSVAAGRAIRMSRVGRSAGLRSSTWRTPASLRQSSRASCSSLAPTRTRPSPTSTGRCPRCMARRVSSTIRS